jgi:NAD(P)-dependent dehydrogenase (short-subunit alcohol dehydrogenase family)
MAKFDGKIAVITGGAKGIGAAMVKRFFDDGATVVSLDLDLAQVEATAKEVDPSGAKVFAMKCDVGSESEVNAVFAEIVEKHGTIDILINNAGITRDAMLHKMSLEQWNAVINVNLNGMYYCCKAAVPSMRAQESGKIVNISSSSAWGNAGQTNYSASKGAVIGFTRSLAKELGRKNINVNCIAPAMIDTDMTKAMPEEIADMAVLLTPLCRKGQPSEVASVASFLASDDASFITGECVQTGGGFVMA